MFSGLFLLLAALIAGYLCPFRSERVLKTTRRLSLMLLYLILFCMGLGLAGIDNLAQQLLQLTEQTLLISLALLVANLCALRLIAPFLDLPHLHDTQEKQRSGIKLGEPLRLIAMVVLGLCIGLSFPTLTQYQSGIAKWALIALIWAIGVDLRSAGMSIRELLFNRRGLMIALVVVLSSMPVGLLAAWYFEFPWAAGLAMTSGFGWYSLSGALISDGYSPMLGTCAFLLDLMRELITLLLIPVLLPRHSAPIVGYAGATAMDFSLPMLQRAGGNAIVPLAIASGFVLSVLCPVLIIFWLSFL